MLLFVSRQGDPRPASARAVSRRNPLAGILIGGTLASTIIFQACRPGGPDDGGPVGPEPPIGASITLAWDSPRTDAMGEPLDDLAGFRIYYGGTSPLDPVTDVFLDAGLATMYTISGLDAGTYFFAVSAVDVNGNESSLSGEIGAELSLP